MKHDQIDSLPAKQCLRLLPLLEKDRTNNAVGE